MTKTKTILVCGLDAIKHKNLIQLEGLINLGYKFIIITADFTGNSDHVVKDLQNIELRLVNRRFLRFQYIYQVFRAIILDRPELIEIYPYGLLQLLTVVTAKIARIPVLVIARGQELEYLRRGMSTKERWSFYWTYRLAGYVIYKELYMEEFLKLFSKKKMWLLPNAVNIPEKINKHEPDKCFFLFLNTMKRWRHPEIALRAFLRICVEMKLRRSSKIRLLFVGFMDKKAGPNTIEKESLLRSILAGNRDVPVDLLPWTNSPKKWLDQADVFILPADIVFLNNSLLEAMARGVPVIVQDTHGSELIVTHDEDGFILPPDEHIWYEFMLRFIQDTDLRQKMGLAARRKVSEKFSAHSYVIQYDHIYSEIMSTSR